MRVGHHFVSYCHSSVAKFAADLVLDLEQRHEGLRCWLADRDLSDRSDPLEQIDEAIRRCSSLIVILADPADAYDERCVSEWRQAISYKKTITVVRPESRMACPLQLDTRRSFDFSTGRDKELRALIDRLLGLSTPAGQEESLREQLAALQRAIVYAKPESKTRWLWEISILEQQIASLEASPQQEHVVQERIASGLERERKPLAETKESVDRLRVVNAPPFPVPRYFENRFVETGLIGDFLRDDAACILTVHGRGGVGKTALVCRVLKNLENDVLPDEGGSLKVAAVVYVNATRASANLFPQLLSGLLLTLDKNVRDDVRAVVENPAGNATTKLKELLPRLPRDPIVMLLDNFEDVVSPQDIRIHDAEIVELLRFVSEAPRHSLKIIITTRIVPEEVLRVSPGRQMMISLSDGLASPYAEKVLRKIDSDGRAGLRDAPDATLSAVAAQTRGFPRALEAFYSIIAADPTKEIADLIADLRNAAYPAERLTQVLVGEAYGRLLPIDEKVMQALAIFGRPVSVNAVEYLLEDWASYLDSAAALKRLESMHFVRREVRALYSDPRVFYLHPIDREHSLSFLSEGEKNRLRGRAADYYQETGNPRSEWKTLADVEPHLEQFRLRLEAGDAETASYIVDDLGGFLLKRGAFEQALSLAQALSRSTADNDATFVALTLTAHAQWRLGRLTEAVAAQERVVEMVRHNELSADISIEEGNLLVYRVALGATEELLDFFRKYLAELETVRPWEKRLLVICLVHVASCLAGLGYLDEALVHQRRATDLASQIAEPDLNEANIHNLGKRLADLGQAQEAEKMYRQALSLFEESGNPLWKANHLTGLAECAQSQGRFEEAQQLIASALELRNEIRDLGGIAADTGRQAAFFLAAGETEKASNIAIKSYEQARDLKIRLRDYCLLRAQISLARGELAQAHQLLVEQEDDHVGARWNFDNALGTTLFRQNKTVSARAAFARALAQSELWLSRSNANRDACAGKALALAGFAACGDADALERSTRAYHDALGDEPGVGDVATWRERLRYLAVGAKSGLQAVFLSVFGETIPANGLNAMKSGRNQVFISYAHEDKPWVEKLAKVLSPAIRNQRLDVWYDAKIKPGAQWRKEIETALKSASVGVLFVSPDFLASEFIAREEMPFLLDAAQKNAVKLLWIYVAPSLVEETRLTEFQCAHSYDRPLDSLAPHELSQCLLEIARVIKAAYGPTE